MEKKERDRMRYNIAIKEVEPKGELKLWVRNFLQDRIKVRCNIVEARMSGKVIVVKLEEEQDKTEIMRNKNRLIGGTIYIENDLTREERHRQKEIWEWVKDRKARGEDVKIGLKRVRIKGIWRSWEEIEKGEEKEREERKETSESD